MAATSYQYVQVCLTAAWLLAAWNAVTVEGSCGPCNCNGTELVSCPDRQVISLSEKQINTLTKKAFNGTTSLKTLDLSLNTFLTLPAGIFHQNPQLSNLDLSLNLLIELPPGVFQHNSKLSNVSLHQNALMDLPAKIFDYTPQLKYVDLSYNVINVLPAGIFAHTPQLITLNLETNTLSNVSINLLDNTPNLQNLILTANNIQKFPMGFFDKLPELKKLLMESNKIEKLQPGLFRSNSKLSDLAVKSNPVVTTPNKACGLKGHYKNNDPSSVIQSFHLQLNNHCPLGNESICLTAAYSCPCSLGYHYDGSVCKRATVCQSQFSPQQICNLLPTCSVDTSITSDLTEKCVCPQNHILVLHPCPGRAEINSPLSLMGKNCASHRQEAICVCPKTDPKALCSANYKYQSKSNQSNSSTSTATQYPAVPDATGDQSTIPPDEIPNKTQAPIAMTTPVPIPTGPQTHPDGDSTTLPPLFPTTTPTTSPMTVPTTTPTTAPTAITTTDFPHFVIPTFEIPGIPTDQQPVSTTQDTPVHPTTIHHPPTPPPSTSATSPRNPLPTTPPPPPPVHSNGPTPMPPPDFNASWYETTTIPTTRPPITSPASTHTQPSVPTKTVRATVPVHSGSPRTSTPQTAASTKPTTGTPRTAASTRPTTGTPRTAASTRPTTGTPQTAASTRPTTATPLMVSSTRLTTGTLRIKVSTRPVTVPRTDPATFSVHRTSPSVRVTSSTDAATPTPMSGTNKSASSHGDVQRTTAAGSGETTRASTSEATAPNDALETFGGLGIGVVIGLSCVLLVLILGFVLYYRNPQTFHTFGDRCRGNGRKQSFNSGDPNATRLSKMNRSDSVISSVFFAPSAMSTDPPVNTGDREVLCEDGPEAFINTGSDPSANDAAYWSVNYTAINNQRGSWGDAKDVYGAAVVRPKACRNNSIPVSLSNTAIPVSPSPYQVVPPLAEAAQVHINLRSKCSVPVDGMVPVSVGNLVNSEYANRPQATTPDASTPSSSREPAYVGFAKTHAADSVPSPPPTVLNSTYAVASGDSECLANAMEYEL